MQYLGMKSSLLPIVVSPNKNNNRFTVVKANSKLHCFDWLLKNLKEKKDQTPFFSDFFLMELGQSGVYVEGEGPTDEKCLLGVYYSQTPQSHKDCITKSFEGWYLHLHH